MFLINSIVVVVHFGIDILGIEAVVVVGIVSFVVVSSVSWGSILRKKITTTLNTRYKQQSLL